MEMKVNLPEPMGHSKDRAKGKVYNREYIY
jgi:hypothetical protein